MTHDDDELLRTLQGADSLLEPSILAREVTFRLKDIPDVKVTVRIWFDHGREGDPYRFELSHYAQVPGRGPYVPSIPWYATEPLALRHGIRAITDSIAQGKRDGHRPEPSWLKPAST